MKRVSQRIERAFVYCLTQSQVSVNGARTSSSNVPNCPASSEHAVALTAPIWAITAARETCARARPERGDVDVDVDVQNALQAVPPLQNNRLRHLARGIAVLVDALARF